jgi:hypothetical protein
VVTRGTVPMLIAAFAVELQNYQSSRGQYRGYQGAVNLPTNLGPIPKGATPNSQNYAGLLSVQLPLRIKRGQALNIIVRGPIVLIGHSLGADAVVEVADALARYNIPVALMVLFDGTEPHQIPANVATTVNYTKHFMITPATGSSGVVSNVDFSGDANVDHLSIDTVPSLQAQTLDYILQAGSAVPRKPVSRRR